MVDVLIAQPPLVLHVGCGAKTIAQMPHGFQAGGFREIRFDIDENVKPDVRGTIQDMKGVETASVDALYSSHNVEHVWTFEILRTLQEFRRVLKPDGFAVITCPDLQEVGRLLAEGRMHDPLYQSPAGPITALDIVFGHIASIARGNDYMAHRTGYSLKSLVDWLGRAGFAGVAGKRVPHRYELWAIATKNKRSEAEMRDLLVQFTQA